MSGARKVEVLFAEKQIAERVDGARRGNRRRQAQGPAGGGDPQGLVHVRRRPAARDASRRSRAACRVLPSVELSRGHGVVGHGEDPARHRILGEGPRRRADRRHPRIRPHARLRQGSAGGARRAAGAGVHAAGEARASARCRSPPISSASSAPTISSSAMAWTSPIPIANCRIIGHVVTEAERP